MKRPVFLILSFFILLTGCAVNPVTGERELALLSPQREVDIGKKQYLPSIQMQGGPYAVNPEINSYVQKVGRKLAAISSRDLPYEFAVINNSVPNAWALPGGKIAVNRGLLFELENEAELAAVIGHEIVHAAARHGAKQVERGLLIQGGVMAAGLAVKDSDYAHLAVGGAQLAAQLINQKYSREAEIEADYYGMRYMAEAGYDPEAAVSLQKKFIKLADAKKSSWLEGLFSSHPPSRQRLEANKKTARELRAGGLIFKERYQQKIAPIREKAPAYVAYDQGLIALKKGNLDKAAELADKALEVEPEEGKFYGLQGDILAARHNYQQALEAYDRGIYQPGEFFELYLQRGLVRKKLGRTGEAEIDFQKSLELLPTAVAYNELGRLALAENKSQKAKEYFRQAAASQSRAGKEALSSLIRLDLPDNPEKYIRLRAETNDRNIIEEINVENTTPLPVKNIVITASYTRPDGSSGRKRLEYPLELAAGRTVKLKTSLPAASLLLQVTSAQLN
ncbi:MAG: M48 family metalloprotease [Thermodesulfobacteriota bacterium]